MPEEMVEIKVRIPKKALKALEATEEFCQKCIREESIKRLWWDDIEILYGDLLGYGGLKFSEDPFAFFNWIRDARDPLFREEIEEEKAKESMQENLWRMYR